MLTLPISRALRDEGLHRYGLHGLSSESIVHQLLPDLPARLVIAHLGSGASVTAIRDGRSVDTSMGFTPSGGIIMATRSGDLNSGILIELLREKSHDATALEQLVDHQSGLLGVSGVSGDMRRLHADAATNPDARLVAAGLAALAGYADAIGFLKLGGLFVSFTSGNSTRLAIGIARHSAVARNAAALVAIFVLGAILGSLAATAAGKHRKPAVLLLVTAAPCGGRWAPPLTLA